MIGPQRALLWSLVFGLGATLGCTARNGGADSAGVARELAAVEARRFAHTLSAPSDPQAQATGTPAAQSTRTLALRTLNDDGVTRGNLRLGVFDSDDAGGVASSRPAGEAARKPPLPGLWQTVRRDIGDAPHDIWHDTKRVYGNPINLAILGVSYGGALALQQGGPDHTIEQHYNHHHSFDKGWRDTFDAVGNPATHLALAGAWYLVGQQTQADKPYEVGKTLISALLINDASVLLGWAASSDRGPNGKYGAFPSGHTSSSFCIAAVMHEAYGPVVGIPLYGLAALVGIQRLDAREHYFSDVAFGAVLGTLIGHSVAGGRDPEIFGWKIIPFADPYAGTTGIALAKELP